MKHPSKTIVTVLTAAGGILTLTSPPPAQAQCEQQKLTASDVGANDLYGNSVSVSGDTAVVGARFHNDKLTGSSSAYVFQRDPAGAGDWSQVHELTAADAGPYSDFGWSVAVSGDTVIVGAWYNTISEPNSGSAYVFQRDNGGPNNWGQAKRLLQSDPDAFDFFGASVAISGDTAIVADRVDGGFLALQRKVGLSRQAATQSSSELSAMTTAARNPAQRTSFGATGGVSITGA